MIQKIKELRVTIDGLAQMTKELKPVGAIIPNTAKYYLSTTQTEAIDNLFEQVNISSYELINALNSLLLAKAWLGNLLGLMGEQTPYANDGKRSDVKDIESVADSTKIQLVGQAKSPDEKGAWNIDGKQYKNHIEKVDWLREEIKRVIEPIQKDEFIFHQPVVKGIEAAIARTNCYNHLCEARFHLGFELSRLRDEASKTSNL